MSKWQLASLAALLVGAGFTYGQAQDPAVAPAPAAGETVAPPPTMVETATPASGPAEGLKCCLFTAPGLNSRGVWTAEADYALWDLHMRHATFPLATTVPPFAPAALVPGTPGALNHPGTVVLGSLTDADAVRTEPGSGGRFAVGYWVLEENPWTPGGLRELGVEATFFFVGQRSGDFMNSTSPFLFRPFFDVTTDAEAAFLVAAPGIATGAIFAHDQLNLWGAEINGWKNVCHDCPGTTVSVDVLAGFRYLDMDQRLNLGSVSVFTAAVPAFPTAAAGDRLLILDSFATHNHFYGGQVGAAVTWWPMEWFHVQGGFKLALGETVEDIEIAGGQLRQSASGATAALPVGLFAQPSNSGHFRRDKFTEVPEFTGRVEAPLLSCLTLSVQVSALYWSRMAEAGLQIDRAIDFTQVQGRPSVPFTQSDLWLLGLSVGLEYTW